jgi:hypothetical protein
MTAAVELYNDHIQSFYRLRRVLVIECPTEDEAIDCYEDRHILFFLSSVSMDLSALQAAAKDLESSLDSLGFWLFASTAIVVIDLIVEYRQEVVEFWEEVRRPAAMFPWHKFWAITGGILVTVGVAGELIVGIKASRRESDLRTINHQIEGLLTDQASENNREARQLEEVAEGERLTRIKLEKEIAPRTLDDAAREQMGKDLSKFSSHFSGRKVKVSSYSGDAEGIVFSLEIIDAGTSRQSGGSGLRNGRYLWLTAVAHYGERFRTRSN